MSINRGDAECCHWAMVGGGMMGLTLAHRLAQQGQRVTVLEAAPEIGGLASAWQLGELTWDRHYHVTLYSDLQLRQLLSELDLEQQMRWVETKTGFYTGGRLYSMSNSIEFLRFPPLNWIEKLRLGATIFRASKIRDWRPLEQVLVADWLRKWSGESTFQKIWRPLLQAKLGATYQRVSAAFIWATIARMYQARQSGMKKELFGYLPGGYAHLLRRFAEQLRVSGVEVQTSAPVSQIVSESDGRVRLDVGETTDRRFDRVVLTVPAPVVGRLCPQLPADERKRYEAIEYLGILCASVVLKRPLANYYVTNITDDWAPFTAVIEMTALVDPDELGGRHLVYLPRYVAADDPAWQWSDEQLQERFLAALEQMYPHFHRRDVLTFRVSRVKHVLALPTLRYSQQLPPMATSVANVFVVNAAHIVKGTLNVNEVIDLANHALRDHLLPSACPAEPMQHESQKVLTCP